MPESSLTIMHLFYIYGISLIPELENHLFNVARERNIRFENDDFGCALRKLDNWKQGVEAEKEATKRLSKEGKSTLKLLDKSKLVKLFQKATKNANVPVEGQWVSGDHEKLAKAIKSAFTKEAQQDPIFFSQE